MSGHYRSYDVSTGRHGTAQEEWAPHAVQTEKTFEWWYITNILKTDAGDTLFQHIILLQFGSVKQLQDVGLPPEAGRHYLLSFALSDYARNLRIGEEMFAKLEKDFDPARNAVMYDANGFFLDWAHTEEGMTIEAKSPAQGAKLKLTNKSGILWHKDKLGFEGMIAESAPDEPSFYYSVPTLQVEGSIEYTDKSGKKISTGVVGEGWCDRQWGDYLTKSWEWCSMRFFDGERVNLYAFPQTGHKVGTYLDKNGNVSYFDNFTVRQKSYFETPNGIWLARAWEYDLPIKGKAYSVKAASEKDLFITATNTLLEGKGFLYDRDGNQVGYAVNESMDIRVTGTGPYKNVI